MICNAGENLLFRNLHGERIISVPKQKENLSIALIGVKSGFRMRPEIIRSVLFALPRTIERISLSGDVRIVCQQKAPHKKKLPQIRSLFHYFFYLFHNESPLPSKNPITLIFLTTI